MKVVGCMFLAFLIVGAVLFEQGRINHRAAAQQGIRLHRVNVAADRLIQSCGRPQHESAISSPSPQLTYDSYHLTITVAFNADPIFVDTETDDQTSRDTAVHTMPCLAQWLAQESLAQANVRH